MKVYLSTDPVWLEPTADIRALNGKSIVIVDEGSRTPAYLSVSDADPASREAGKCALIAWQASMTPMGVEWANAGSAPPTSRVHRWERYITEDALRWIRANEPDPEYGDLVLEVPSASS